MSAGYPGIFTGGLTTGFQTIGGAQKGSSSAGYPGIFPGALTTGQLHIGAIQRNPNNNWVDTFSDSVTSSDAQSVILAIAQTISDSITSSDTQSGLMEAITTLSDSLTASDTQGIAFAATATFSDSVTGADDMGAAMATAATFSDSVTPADSYIGGIGYFNTITDSVTATDLVTGTMGVISTFSDGITVADSVSGGVAYSNTIDDTLTASDSFNAVVSPSPNIILTGTIDFRYPTQIPNQVITNLDFGVILGDDNFIRVNATNLITSQPFALVSTVIYFYAPNTNTNPVITKSGICANGYFQFELAHTDIASLPPALYPWLAVITLTDGSSHILNLGDDALTTGVMTLVNRPF